jgi:KDO2-lipid IV(A) lauroyltransferase
MQGMKAMVLTLPDPRGGRRKEYEMRKKNGVNLVPSTVGGFLQAVRHLQQGGFVATGIDRPIPQPRIRPQFFGRPASLPLHHIFLAIKAKVPVMLMVTIRRPDGTNCVFSTDRMEMDSYPDRETEVRRNAEKVLGVAEEYIRMAPQQWSVSLPVWPEVADGISQ